MPDAKYSTFAPLGDRAAFVDQNLSAGETLHGFAVESVEDLPEIDGTAYVAKHAKSGARLLFLHNDDENKSFSIAFKTPPVNDTGVFHILEHSVLCGSEKFPVKEPFVNLLKGSMQTFLNALTFPDKTMYPVASTNDQDLLNLIDVYMDAVLRPAIYQKQTIFQQEGWHYEFDAEASVDEGSAVGEDVSAALEAPVAAHGETAAGRGALRYNGVVFNEMKGALSDPDGVLYHSMNKALFPDTCYACESGGHPRSIPQLTYQEFLDTHARHYRLDNAYIVLYGNVDVDCVLRFLDEEYLSNDACAPRSEEAPNEIKLQEPCVNMDVVVPMDTAQENACIGLGYVVGKAQDFERALAVDVLLDALMGGNESLLKRALLDAELSGDATAYLIDSQLQTVALFQLKNANPDVAQRFVAVVESEVKKLIDGGIPKDVLAASLAQLSFDLRERDRGIADGVALAMNSLAGWLYDDDGALTYLRYESALNSMRKGLEGTYFEDLLASLVLDSSHKALVEIRPQSEAGITEEEAELAAKQESLSEEDCLAIEANVAKLRTMQEAIDAPEDLATLPHLYVSDIGEAKPDPAYEVLDDTPLTCLYHNLPTRRINYAYYYFNLNALTWEDMPYVSVLTMLLTKLRTEKHSAAELDVLMRSHLGSLRYFVDAYAPDDNPEDISAKLVVGVSALAEEMENLVRIPQEIWESTCFDDANRIKDVLVQRRISMEQSFMNDGHTRAMNRLGSYFFHAGVLREHMSGVDFYLFLKDLIDNFEDRFEDLQAKLQSIVARVFVQRGAVVSFTGSQEDLQSFWEIAQDMNLPEFAPECVTLPNGATVCALPSAKINIPDPVIKNEAFAVPTDVCYVAKGANVSPAAMGQGQTDDFDGSWIVLMNALSLDYLWNEVRVKGGAYGVGFRRGTEGFARFYSYRDPSVDATLERYDQVDQWVDSFDPEATEMEGYIVSSVATQDAPAKPRMIARRQDSAYFTGKPLDWRERVRAQELATTPETLRAHAQVFRTLRDQGAVCAFGNEGALRASKLKDNVVALLQL